MFALFGKHIHSQPLKFEKITKPCHMRFVQHRPRILSLRGQGHFHLKNMESSVNQPFCLSELCHQNLMDMCERPTVFFQDAHVR